MKKVLTPLDISTLLYTLLSGVYLMFSSSDADCPVNHITMRVVLFLLLGSLVFLKKRYPSNKPLAFVRNLYPLLFLGFFYIETSCMKNIIFNENFDQFFFNLEQTLWNCQPSLIFEKVMPQIWFNELMNLCYFSYYLLIGSVCIYIYLKSPSTSQKSIFIVVFSFYLYYLIFDFFPVAGPHYFVPDADAETIPKLFFGNMMNNIITDLERPTGAFPSSHVGIGLIIAYVAYLHSRKVFYCVLPFVLGICLATVYIKAHYLVDVIAGIVSAPLFIVISNKVYSKLL
jgi:membrane-associated phospholipid phosphatase